MALIQCPECSGQVSDRAQACPHCGCPLQAPQAAPAAKRGRPAVLKQEDLFRLPNGYGTIKALKGNRRKPFAAYVNPRLTLNENTGRSYYTYDPLGTFTEKIDAYIAIMQYNKTPGELNSNITIKELFDKWCPYHISENNFDDAARKKYEATFEYCQPLYKVKVVDSTPALLKEVLNSAHRIGRRGKTKGEIIYATPNIKNNIKALLNMMYDYAIFLRIITVNYARTFEHKINLKGREGRPYSLDEQKLLWDHSGSMFIDMTLVQIYSGWRPSEVLDINLDKVDLINRTFTTGSKTEAGRDRTVPIHSKILPIVKHYYVEANSVGRNVLFGRTTPRNKSFTYSANSYRYELLKEFEELKITDHVLHDARHTFSSLAKIYKMDDFARKKFMGHNIADLTDRVYTHLDMDWFRDEIEKIK